MTGTHLSPAMRTMLRNAITGMQLYAGLPRASLQAGGGTRDALVKRGLLAANAQPTTAGYTVFAPTQHPMEVWFLTGPQGCGKTRWAEQAIQDMAAMGRVGVWLDTDLFEREYAGNPQRVKDAYPDLSVLMLEDNRITRGNKPPHSMQADRVIDLTDSLKSRRPETQSVATKLRITYPAWPENKVLTTAKVIVTRRACT